MGTGYELAPRFSMAVEPGAVRVPGILAETRVADRSKAAPGQTRTETEGQRMTFVVCSGIPVISLDQSEPFAFMTCISHISYIWQYSGNFRAKSGPT